MGLTKQYLAYQHTDTFNIIASGRANVNFCIYDSTDGRYVIVPAVENVILWDMKLSQKLLQYERKRHYEVTALRVSPNKFHVAVGYSDGVVEIFEIDSQNSVTSLALHKSCVTTLRFDEIGMRLISGSLDTEIVISDIIEQVGKHRLIGHNAPITDGHFLDHIDFSNIVVTSSKDTQIKFWDLETRNCFKTIVDNRTEVWGLAFVGNLLITGSKESVLNVYRIKSKESEPLGLIEGLCLDDDDVISPINVIKYGVIQRVGKGRTVSLVMDKTKRILSCHGTDDIVESFYFRTNEEAKLQLTKRLKKKSSKNEENVSTEISLTDEIKRLPTLKCGAKIKSIDVVLGKNNELRIALSTAKNVLQMHSIDIKKRKEAEAELLRTISKCGHQSEVRAVCFSSDSTAIASGSAESLKLWNRDSMQCIKTISSDSVLCLCFAPGDRYILAGLKTGKLIIADVAIGEIIEEIAAHQSEIWSVCLLPDLKGCVTGSGDATVKIWNFELIENSIDNEENVTGTAKILSLIHSNTLKVEEGILAVKISPNSKFITVALLDSTVKIFFLDSFKFYLSLYGHNLPVLCTDISYDSNLIITGSADRKIRIWGLDFGDCHKSLLAHDDSVIALQFIPKTHLFFSCGKDGKIKQWDADSFDKIITLPGHIGEIWSLSISQNARYFVTSGSDRCLRLFEKTEEPIVLQDVQEDEREEYENKMLATGDDNDIPAMPGYKLPSRKTVGSEKSAELILECLDIIKEFENSEAPDIHPLMKAYQAQTPNDFLIAIFQNIRASDIEEALVLLPFPYVCQLLERIPELSANRQDQTELICKIALFLLRIHYKPIVSNQILLQTIKKIGKTLEQCVVELRDLIGSNFCSLQLLQHDIEEQEGVKLFEDVSRSKKRRDKIRKRNQKAKRLHIQMS